MSEDFGVTVTVTTTAQMFVAPVVTKRERGKDEAILVLVPEREGSQMRVGVPIEEYTAEKQATLVQIVQTEGPAHLGVFSRERKVADAAFHADEDIPEWLVDVSSDMFDSLGMNVSEAVKERQRAGIRDANLNAEAKIAEAAATKHGPVEDFLREAGISASKLSGDDAVEFDSVGEMIEGIAEEGGIEILELVADEIARVVDLMRAKVRVEKRREAIASALKDAPDSGPVSDMASMSQALAMLRSIGVL